MPVFQLPKETAYGRVIPKNAFDEYTNSKQKKELSTFVKRISWTHKLSTETTNLPSSAIKEIQVIYVELKMKSDLNKILEIIDRSIPYHIIFVLSFEEELKFSTAAKHLHATKLNQSVIDCTFSSEWYGKEEHTIELVLKESLEQAFISFCDQITGRQTKTNRYADFVAREVKIKEIAVKIKALEAKVKSEQQFNKKIQLNMELNRVTKELQLLLN